jgi:hypothetical protein
MYMTLSSRVSLMMAVLVSASSLTGCEGDDSKFVQPGQSVGLVPNSSNQQGVQGNDIGGLRTEARISDELLQATLAGLQDQIDALKKRDEELAKEIGNVRTELGERIAAVEARLSLLEADVNRKTEQISELKASLAVNDERVAKIQEEINGIQADLAQNYATKAELSVLQAAQAKIQGNLSLLNSEIYGEDSYDKLVELTGDGTLVSRLDQIDSDLAAALERIAANESAIAVHNELIATYRADFEAEQKNIDKLLQDVYGAVGGDGLLAKMDILTGDVAAMNIRIENTSKNLASFYKAATEGEYSEEDTNGMQEGIAEYFRLVRIYEQQVVESLLYLSGQVTLAINRADEAHALAVKNDSDLREMIVTFTGKIDTLSGRVEHIEGFLPQFMSVVDARFSAIEGQVSGMLDGLTPREFANQFKQTVIDVGQVKLSLQSLEENLDARILDAIGTSDLAKKVDQLEVVQGVMNVQIPTASNYLKEYAVESMRLLSSFFDLIAPVSGGTIAIHLSNTFLRDVSSNSVCRPFSIANADFKNVFGTDYFMILARYYAEAFAWGLGRDSVVARAGGMTSAVESWPEGIFHGLPGFVSDDDRLLRMTLAPLFRLEVPPLSDASEIEHAAACQQLVRDWAHDSLFGSSLESDRAGAAALQQALASSQTIRALLETLATIGNKASAPLAVIAETISGQFPAAFQQLQAEVAAHTQRLLALEEKLENVERRMNSEFATAQQFAQATANAETVDAAIIERVQGLEGKFEGLKSQVASLAATLDEHRAEQAGTNSTIFAMIAAIATELDLDDIAKEARERQLPLDTDFAIPPSTGNEPGLGIHNAGMSYTECSSLIGTRGYSKHSWIANQFNWLADSCAVNFRQIPSNLVEDTLTLGSFRVRIASTGVKRIVVSVAAMQGPSVIAASVQSGAFDLENPDENVTAVAGDWVVGLFDINVNHLIRGALEGNANRRLQFTITGYFGDGPVGSPVQISIGFYSPLILNFAGTHSVATKDAMSSGVRFDLDGDGRPEGTGWLARGSSVGFLAADLNGNGRIDDGSELFGEATLLQGGERAKNGYVALAMIDSNKDGLVNAVDKEFDKLVVWFDRNLNGQSDAGELVSLKDAEVTALATSYSEVTDPAKRAQSVLENDHRYEARFWGPKQCGTEGCASYDIFFSKASELAKN